MIRVGNQKGLKNYVELRRIAFSIILLSAIFASLFCIMFFALHNHLPKLYLDLDDLNNLVDNTEVVAIASKLLILAAIFQLSDSLQVVILGALRGLQDVKIPTIITFIAYWIIGFPISYIFGKEEAYGSLGIWLGLLAGLTSAAIMLYIRFNYLTKKLIQSQHGTT
jgi:MATE family multidrug resistance protein